MGHVYGASHLRGTFEGLAAKTGRDVAEFQRAAARDDGSLADVINESTAFRATQDRLAAYRTGHTYGPDALAKIEARQESSRALWDIHERAEEPEAPTHLGSRAQREIRLKRDPSWMVNRGDDDD